jgi:phosphopantetheinyl transferase (holo-ACP synthase)
MSSHSGLLTEKLALRRPDVSFSAALALSETPLGELEKAASEFLHRSELERLSGLASPVRRHRFLNGRFAAKHALAATTGSPLTSWTIISGIFGQPVVAATQPGEEPLDISITHCRGISCALAFPARHPLATDLGPIATGDPTSLLRQMTARERALAAELGGAGPSLLWAAKEALSKALRTGLSVDIDILEVSELAPVRWACSNSWSARFSHFGQWKALLIAAGGFVLALLVPGKTETTFAPAITDWLTSREIPDGPWLSRP